MTEQPLTAEEIIAEIRSIAGELKIYRPCPGEVLPATKQRVADFLLRAGVPFGPWSGDREILTSDGTVIFNGAAGKSQVHASRTKGVRDSEAGKLSASIAGVLLLAEWPLLPDCKHWSADHAEQQLREAFSTLPELCDRLKQLPVNPKPLEAKNIKILFSHRESMDCREVDSSVLSPSESENEGTTEGTKNIESGDTDDNSKRKTKRSFCPRCEQLKRNWFNQIEREKRDIPLQTFLKGFFVNPRKEAIWNPIRKGVATPTNWEAMEKKFRANEAEWNPEYLELIANLRGTIGGH